MQQTQTETQIAKTNKESTMAERFTNMVMAKFSNNVGELELTNFQKRLIQNYFITADIALRAAEEKRLKKNEKYRDSLPVTWANVDLEQLSQDVVTFSRIGLDPAQKNHVALIAFKKNAINKYGLTFMEEYRGIELKARKYGLDVPDNVIVELVYSNDKFKSYKKDRNNKYEDYEFEVTNEFDRGEIVGGFYYHNYTNNPEKNKLVVFSLKDIIKRKPDYASAEFWGGEKDVWKDGKKVGKEHTDGWYEKMCYKTIYRAAYSDITIDSQKIDDDYLRLRQMEAALTESKVEQEINENANSELIDISDYKVTDPDDVDPVEDKPAKNEQSNPLQQDNCPEAEGPDF